MKVDLTVTVTFTVTVTCKLWRKI